MGLFDPPTKSIAKRVPVSAQSLLGSVQAFCEQALLASLSKTHSACVTAIVMGSWVNAHAQLGRFDMQPRDLDYVRNMVLNCGRMCGGNEHLAEVLIRDLIAKELMPNIFGN